MVEPDSAAPSPSRELHAQPGNMIKHKTNPCQAGTGPQVPVMVLATLFQIRASMQIEAKSPSQASPQPWR